MDASDRSFDEYAEVNIILLCSVVVIILDCFLERIFWVCFWENLRVFKSFGAL